MKTKSINIDIWNYWPPEGSRRSRHTTLTPQSPTVEEAMNEEEEEKKAAFNEIVLFFFFFFLLLRLI